MVINKHTLVHANDAGNGYHGRCEHCGVALVTDLGYCSWEGVKCVDREIDSSSDIPGKILSYANFNGYSWSYIEKLFIKPYGDQLSIDEINERISMLEKEIN